MRCRLALFPLLLVALAPVQAVRAQTRGITITPGNITAIQRVVNNTLFVIERWRSNTVTSVQTGNYNSVDVIERGRNNTVNLDQTGVTNDVVVNERGYDNTANVSQTGVRNLSVVNQHGYENAVAVNQNGTTAQSVNQSFIYQQGFNNAAQVGQAGGTNTSTITQVIAANSSHNGYRPPIRNYGVLHHHDIIPITIVATGLPINHVVGGIR